MSSLAVGAQRASSQRVAIGFIVALFAAVTAAPSVSAATLDSAASPGSSATIAVDATTTPESYYLRLLNCTRTGGWVTSTGSCLGYGSGRYSRYVSPIRYSTGITLNVSRPYARLLAVRNKCDHFLDHDPGYRLRRAGYRGYAWGENIGCSWGMTVYRSILASHRSFQAEKWTNGGHWRNIKNARFRYVGIGVASYAGRVRLVTDFYSPT